MAENEVIEDISTDLKYFIKSIVPNSKYKNTELDTNEETNSDGYLSNISKDLKYFIKCIVPNSVYKDDSNPVPGSGGDSGEEVIANDSSYLYSLVVDGKAVQDGTPTPSEPVPIQVVGLNNDNEFGIQIGETLYSIDLQGNVLASLPDGTKDVLTVDSVGHVVMEKRTFIETYDGTDMSKWSTSGTTYLFGVRTDSTIESVQVTADNSLCSSTVYKSITGSSETIGYSNTTRILRFRPETNLTLESLQTYFQNHPTTFVLPLAAPQTIDLGYIDIPQIPDGSEIKIIAQITPNIDVEWWTINQDATARAIYTVMDEIETTETNVLNNIAKVENGKASVNYSVGSYLVNNGKLYKVTSAIASGENIVPGTNVTATTVMAELVALTS